MPELLGGAGGVSGALGGGGGVGGMFDCGEAGGIGAVGGGVSVGLEGGVGGWFCASKAPDTSSEPAARADNKGLRGFIIDTPCQNAGARIQANRWGCRASSTLANDL